jgi:CHAD domain-containing protein
MTFTQLRDESPKALREPITLILDFYQKREKKLTKKLTKLIGSDEVQDMLEMILAIKVEDRLFKKVANQPIILTALEVVKNHFDMIVKSGEKIDMSSDDNVYHKIRIAFKKLRYTLDLLAFMTDESKMELFLTDLKSIQTTLGDMHDIQIQRSEIEKIMLNFGENKEFTILLKNMEREEKKLKQQFLKDFKSFTHKKMSYNALFFKKL